MSESRAYTTEEVRKMLVTKFWEKLHVCLTDERMVTPQHKLEVFMHSILATLDGCDPDLPSFLIIPNPHRDDKAYHIKHKGNFFPTDKMSIDFMHEVMYEYKPDNIPEKP